MWTKQQYVWCESVIFFNNQKDQNPYLFSIGSICNFTGQIYLYNKLLLCEYLEEDQQDDKQKSTSKTSHGEPGTHICHVISHVPNIV